MQWWHMGLIGIAVFFIIVLLVKKKYLGTAVKSAACGMAALWIVNMTTGFSGLYIGINGFSLAATLFLGPAGVGGILLTKWVCGI